MYGINELPASAGTYVLVLEAYETKHVQIGRFGRLALRPGCYFYVGSAFGPGGLRARVGRHVRETKSLRWHIDYLRHHTGVSEVWYSENPVGRESLWAGVLGELPGISRPLIGFGIGPSR